MVQVIRKEAVRGTSRHVRTHAYETFRFLLASDDVGATVTDIVLAPGVEEVYGYDRQIEIAYCLEGRAQMTDLGTNAVHLVEPGTLWVSRKGERFRFVASQPTRLICVFVPPFSGEETGFAEDPSSS